MQLTLYNNFAGNLRKISNDSIFQGQKKHFILHNADNRNRNWKL